MKNKGFTLVEIIAVIIILGILMIITIPSISRFISDSRNQAYYSHERSMEQAAENYTIDCINNNEQNCLIPRNGEEINILLSELEDKEFIDKLQNPSKQGAYCNPEESYVKIRKSDDIDFEYMACLYCGTYSTENDSCVKIDVTPTTIQCGTNIIGAGETWTRDSRTISINCVDSANSCRQERFEKTFGSTMEYGNITIYDMNPARGTKSCRVPVRIDLEKPTCSLDVTGDKRGGYYVDDVTVSMPSSGRKDTHSGVGTYGLGTSSNNPKYDNKENITISSNGVTRVFGYIKDIVGNEGICSTSLTKVGKYYIIYDKNTGNGTMADTECVFGENCTLRKNTFTKTGYHFNYWSLLSNGNTAKHYDDEEVVKNLTFSDSVRLYIIWEKNQNTLTVNANGGTGGFTEKHEYEYEKNINVARTGYTFNGWGATGTCGTYTDAASTTYTYPANRDTTCTLKAKWNINSNTLIVDSNGGTGDFTKTQNYNTTKSISVSKTGYTFDGWETTGTCGSYTEEASTTYTFPANSGTTCTLKAKWKINTSKLAVNADGGTGGFSAVTQNYNTTKDISVAKTGYTFNSWIKSGTCGSYTEAASTTYTFPANNGTTCTLKAKWNIHSNTLVVDANGGTGGFSAITQNYNTTKAISVSKTGYKLTGWEATGTCGTYTETASTTYTFPENSGTTCTLKAKWEISAQFIYWALQDNNNDSKNETLVLSNTSVDGNKKGSFTDDTVFESTQKVPWIHDGIYYQAGNWSYYVTTVVVEGKITPISTNYWFHGVGYRANSVTMNLTNLNTSKLTSAKSMFDCAGYFSKSFNITGLNNWDTSKVIDMSHMFDGAGRAATSWSIGDLSNWNTSSVTSMSHMFNSAGSDATSWSIGDLSDWNTSSVTSMSNMFSSAGSSATTWNIGNLSNWNTSKVTTMSGMFAFSGRSATTWSIGNLNNWDTSNVTTMGSMFCCAGETATTWNIGNLSNWNTSKVTEMQWMFLSAGSKATSFNLDLSRWNVSNVKYMNLMFDGSGYNSTTWSIGDISNWNVSNVISMANIFDSAGYSATTWNLGNLNNWNVSNLKSMYYMFNKAGYSATTWNIGDISNWNISNVTDLSYTFSGAGHSTTNWSIGNLNNWNTSNVTNMSGLFSGAGQNSTTWSVGNLKNWNTSKVTKMDGTFSSTGGKATNWNVGDISRWDTSSVTVMSSMFSHAGYYATTWNFPNISNWNISNVTDMSHMFTYAGYNLTNFNIDISNWDTSKVTTMEAMFDSAGYESSTFNLDLSNWDVSSVTHMSRMFMFAGRNSTSWSVGNLSRWNVSNVTKAYGMFNRAGEKSTVWNIGNLNNWDVSNITSMDSMFSGAGYSSTIWNIGNLRNWNTSSATSMDSMFECAGYKASTFNLDLSNWDVSKVERMNDMFWGAGYSATAWSVGNLKNWNTSSLKYASYLFYSAGYNATSFSLDLSNWNTSKVYSLSEAFSYTGYNATTWFVKIPKTNNNGLTNTNTIMYGQDEWNAARLSASSNRSFTVSN